MCRLIRTIDPLAKPYGKSALFYPGSACILATTRKGQFSNMHMTMCIVSPLPLFPRRVNSPRIPH